MTRILADIGQRIFISSRHRTVRHGVMLAIGNLFLFAGLLFAAEIALILLGVGNIFLPWTGHALELINRIVF